ncbi:MAG: ABC transporter permease [Bdellovibrio sp.]|nr:ABC transporter permease [Bdellovibrio sp.]
MLRYFIKRLLFSIPSLLVFLIALFFLLRLAPGGPFDGEQVWPPEVQANILKKYHLDQPLHRQLTEWLIQLGHGDLNESFQYLGKPVTEILAETFPVSLLLGTLALGVCISVGIFFGGIAAWRQGSLADRLLLFISSVSISLPVFLIASVLVLIFSLQLKWLPPALWEGPSSAILPVLALSWRPSAIVFQLTRSTLIESLRSDFVRTARGKGVPEYGIIFKHALKNALIPVLGALGPIAANLVTGSFLVELIFQIPGMGKYFVHAVLNRDYPLVMGVTLLYGGILILTHILVDLAYALVDPRIRLGESL